MEDTKEDKDDDAVIMIMVDGKHWKGPAGVVSLEDEEVEASETMPTLSGSQSEDYEASEGGVEINLQQHKDNTDSDNLQIAEKQQQQQQQQQAPKRGCLDHPRVKELYLLADWWTLWLGLLSYCLANVLVFSAVPILLASMGEDASSFYKYVMPQPLPWQTNPLDAWNAYNLVGIPLLFLVFFVMYSSSLWAMGKCTLEWTCGRPNNDDHHTNNSSSNNNHLGSVFPGFCLVSALATLSMWFGRNQWCEENGFGYAVFAIGIGMLVTNALPATWTAFIRSSLAAKDGEFFIKCSLVLLAVELDVLVRVGAPAMVVAWIGSPLTIVLGYLIGTRCCCYKGRKCNDNNTVDDNDEEDNHNHTEDHRALVMLIAVGASWCGASAISAVAPAVMAKPEDVALALSVVACFTVVFTFVQPYIAIAVRMPDAVAGAWIGGSVDQTGNVLVAAAIVSEEATEVAGIVKMVLNSGMGVMASVIAVWWSWSATTFRWIQLWDKFPKFTLGFLITSAMLTGTLQAVGDDNPYGQAVAVALPKAVATLNKWWFAIAFVGIGLSTDIRKLAQEAWQTGVIQIYLVTNTIDILLALGLAYAVY